MTDWLLGAGWLLVLVLSLALWTLFVFAAYGVYLLVT